VSRYRTALLGVLALCWPLGACSTPAHLGPVPVEIMESAPPLVRIEGSSLDPLVVDWAAVDGSASVSAPESTEWSTTSTKPIVLVLQTPVVPVRVITLDFAVVDAMGIPSGMGREQVCDLQNGEARAAAGCAFVDHADRVVVQIDSMDADRYVVVQAAWLAIDTRQVTASWGFRFLPRACCRDRSDMGPIAPSRAGSRTSE
jgi:hypothetical protein